MKVGDYVRTEYGIARYIGDLVTSETNYRTIDKNIVYTNIEGWKNVVTDNEIIKSSPNIIDLIEVGDFVNGVKVDFTNIDNKLTYEDACIGFYDGDGDITLFANDIKSIVTKEQFEAMEYKCE